MKKFFPLALLLFIFSCTPYDVADDRRVLIKGKFVDVAGNPIPNIPVVLLTDTGISYYPSLGYEMGVLQKDSSSVSGEFKFTALDVREANIQIAINVPTWASENPQDEYQSILYFDERDQREELEIDFGTVTLRKPVLLNLVFNNTSGSTQNMEYTITYFVPDPIVPVENWNDFYTGAEDYIQNPFVDFSSGYIENGMSSEAEILTLEGTNVVVNYRIEGEEEVEVNIPLPSENTVYEINY